MTVATGAEVEGCEADVASALQVMGRVKNPDDDSPPEEDPADDDDEDPPEEPEDDDDEDPEEDPDVPIVLEPEECEQVCCYSRFSSPESLCGCLADHSISCNFCSSPYFATPSEYHVPDSGSFNVSILVNETGLTTISQLEVGLGLAGFHLQTLGITLLGPNAESLRLKGAEPDQPDETQEVHWVFSNRPGCNDCKEPVDSLSQLQGKEAKGTWTLMFETDPEVLNGLVSWVELSLTSC